MGKERRNIPDETRPGLSGMTLGKKLGLGFGVLILLMATNSFLPYMHFSRLGKVMEYERQSIFQNLPVHAGAETMKTAWAEYTLKMQKYTQQAALMTIVTTLVTVIMALLIALLTASVSVRQSRTETEANPASARRADTLHKP